MTRLNAIFAVVFALSAVVQLNDPDPILWLSIYCTAMAGCVAWHLGRLPLMGARISGVAALVGAVLLGATGPSGADLSGIAMGWSMNSLASEEVREAGGLFIVGTWLLLLSRQPLSADSGS
jgi:hypothetical protein